MLIVLVNRNAFLVLDDPRGRRSIIGMSLAYAAILNRRFGIPIRRVSLPSTSVDAPADIGLGGVGEQVAPTDIGLVGLDEPASSADVESIAVGIRF
ncbi:hypothetical protein [Mechercharimyces sp. CAU 1602]|uniref:hypothetical protein n=1 Tax=Mechercharimyces sp. CAU 1602 TaxID=2973933 RepID=UPI002163C1B6|nr:hypothetical protein [Mechercharimyces sp. CAU 1602]MCS1351294.1 hypothetical protein [Mechercharimyces sp. CAU 1602]